MQTSGEFVKKLLAFGVGTIVITIVLISLILPDVRSRESLPRSQCMNNLRNISIALVCYHGEYGSLPPPYIADGDGRPMHSWRVLMLPYLDRGDLYAAYRFDEPWDGPNNSKLHNVIVDSFTCPADHGGKRSSETSYVAVVGPETIWPGDHTVRLDDVTDGLGNTLLVVEIANSGVHWMEPRDLEFSRMSRTINSKSGQGISSAHAGGAFVAFADGRVRFLSETTPAVTIEALLTIHGEEKVPDNY